MSNPRIDEILRYQQMINRRTEHRLGILFTRYWWGYKVKIAYTLHDDREYLFELDLNSAYWYVCGLADSLGVSPLSQKS